MDEDETNPVGSDDGESHSPDEEADANPAQTEQRFDGIRTPLHRVREWPIGKQALGVVVVSTIVLLLVLVAIVPPGLLGLVVNDTATFDATPAAVSDDGLATTGYEQTQADTVTVEQHLAAVGQTRTIVVHNHRRTYRDTISVQNTSYDAGMFVALSSPAVTVAGSSQNPLADLSHKELLERFESELNATEGDLTFRKVGERETVLAGRSTTLSEFRTTMTMAGEQRDVAVYVARVRVDGDIVVAVGLHPVAFADQEVSIMQLFYAVEHGELGT